MIQWPRWKNGPRWTYGLNHGGGRADGGIQMSSGVKEQGPVRRELTVVDRDAQIKALSNPERVRILALLIERPGTAKQVALASPAPLTAVKTVWPTIFASNRKRPLPSVVVSASGANPLCAGDRPMQ